MFGVLVFLVALFYLGTRNSEKPYSCLGSIIRAIVIIVLAGIAISLGFTGFFPF